MENSENGENGENGEKARLGPAGAGSWWKRGDSNPNYRLIVRNLPILRKDINTENGKNATWRYTEGTQRKRMG